MSQDSNPPISSPQNDNSSWSEDSTLPPQFGNASLLPPQNLPEKPTVVLDLDRTLVHSTIKHPPERYDFMVSYEWRGRSLNQYVLKRPGLDYLLEQLAAMYEIVIFTSGGRQSASLVVDQIDPRGLISHRLYGDSCTNAAGILVKDLNKIGRELKNVVIVDDNPNAYMWHPENAILVRPFIDDLEDRELYKLGNFLSGCCGVEDMREGRRVHTLRIPRGHRFSWGLSLRV